jgi:hypothetical protein
VHIFDQGSLLASCPLERPGWRSLEWSPHRALLDPPRHRMMHGPRCILSSLPRHPSFAASFPQPEPADPFAISPGPASEVYLVNDLPLLPLSRQIYVPVNLK